MKKPNLIFLMGTKTNGGIIDVIKRKMGYYGGFSMDSIERKDGLALLWKYESQVQLHNFSQRHISTWINDEATEETWLFTSFYGKSKTSKCHKTWSLLRNLKPLQRTPWLLMGDFNEILFNNEK